MQLYFVNWRSLEFCFVNWTTILFNTIKHVLAHALKHAWAMSVYVHNMGLAGWERYQCTVQYYSTSTQYLNRVIH
jgi:hypothetical protein